MLESNSADMEDVNTDQIEQCWFVDLDWFQSNNRSFSMLAQRCLCAKCRQRLKMGREEIPADEILAAIKDCCSQEPHFITGELPILESIFRLFLANGNEPLYLEELGRQLSEWRIENPYNTSVEVLSRLLESDQFYGLKKAETDMR
jgi:hypothetical protein